ncbi:MAG: acyl-CoA thioesterase [Betaproteobacteria bacterium]|nr:acyl-CoA thioesterase [Betaproteobacteria bacterium]MDE2622897.1 acyl-CoA thioesterase [Betaproteobacteria bacterium]
MSRFETKVTIRETHIDFFGHMNNATYMELFEEARWDLITRNGYGIPQILEYKKGPVVLDCHIRFLKELMARDEIIITVEHDLTPTKPNQKVFKLRQQMINAKGEIACEAVYTYGLFDMQARRLVEPTPEWRKAVGE